MQIEWMPPGTAAHDEQLLDLFAACSNLGRWGADDELGTLNFITPETRLKAIATVRTGDSASIGLDLSTVPSVKNANPLVHIMRFDAHEPTSALDHIGVSPHGFSVTHLDAVSHVYWRGASYNGRQAGDISSTEGLSFGSIMAMRNGIVTRGVLLDIAAVRGVEWLEPGDYVTVADLEAAERLAGVRVETGDAVFVHVGLANREAVEGPEDPALRAGLHAEVVPWLFEREIAVYSGDCVERTPYPSSVVPLPLHQVGLSSMGLCLLDCPDLAALVALRDKHDRSEFLLTLAPLRVPGGTGSPVNPIATF